MTDIDLREADLSYAIASDSDLMGADLRSAKFIEADLGKADLRRAKLENANVTFAHLVYADLSGANLTGADLAHANLSHADLSGADLSRAALEGSILNDTNIERAILRDCTIYGASAWNLKGTPEEQTNLVISNEGQSQITVDDIEVAQFIYLLLHNEKIRSVIGTVGKKGVLIIGRFTDERKAILHAIRDDLRDRYDRLPIMFEFAPLPAETTIKTLSTLAHMSRFVIADLSDARAVVQELNEILHGLPTLPIQPILHESAAMPSMADSFLVRDSVLEPYIYSSRQILLDDLRSKVIGPAEERAAEFQLRLEAVRQKLARRKQAS